MTAAPITRKCRQTGTLITVTSAADCGDDEMPWWTICETHGQIVGHDTKALALSHAPDPAGWCAYCQAQHYGTPGPDFEYDDDGNRVYV